MSSRFRRHLIAEAVRLEEDRRGAVFNEPLADTRARALRGDFAERILERAACTELGQRLQPLLTRVLSLQVGLILAMLVFAGLLGASTAALVLGRAPHVDIGWALLSLLGLQTLMLGVWLMALLLWTLSGRGRHRPAIRGVAGIGYWMLVLPRLFGARSARSPDLTDLLVANAAFLQRGGLGRWLASLLTHGFWVAFGLGAFLVCLLSFSMRQYDFVWGTTLLQEEQVLFWVVALGAPAQAVGWTMPDATTVLSSRIGLEDLVGRSLWSAWLLWVLLAYGILPRLLLVLWSGWQVRRALVGLSLDTTLPGYARLAERLRVPSRGMGIVDPAPQPVVRHGIGLGRSHRLHVPVRTLFVIGHEGDPDTRHWPPTLPGVDWKILGRADDRQQQADLFAALESGQETPRILLVLCWLARTPDRGTERFLRHLREHAQAPVWVLLEQGVLQCSRVNDPRLRREQWRQTCLRAGVEVLFDVDLQHPDAPGNQTLLEALYSWSAGPAQMNRSA